MKKSKHKTHLTPNEVAELPDGQSRDCAPMAARGLLRSLTTPGGHRRFLLRDVEEFRAQQGLDTGAAQLGPARPRVDC